MKTISDRGFLPSSKAIKFVLTVPAIWNDRSKQFMREAAIQVWILFKYQLFHKVRKDKIYSVGAFIF